MKFKRVKTKAPLLIRELRLLQHSPDSRESERKHLKLMRASTAPCSVCSPEHCAVSVLPNSQAQTMTSFES